MQIRVDKLRTNLALLQPVMPKNPTLKITNNVILKDGFMRGTNLESEVSLAIPEIGGEAFLMPFKQALELLKYVPGDQIVTIEYKGKSVKLSWNGGSAAYITSDYKDFPESALRAPASEAVLNGDILVGAMKDALLYVARESARPVLNAVAVLLAETIQVCGADGFRASYEALKLSYPVKQTIIVPAETVSILAHLWQKAPGKPGLANNLVAQLTASRPLRLGIWSDCMSAEFNNVTLVSKLVQGIYPDTLALLNGMKEPLKVSFYGPEMLAAVQRLANVASEGTNIVRLQWTDTTMTVSASANEVGEIEVELPVQEGSQPGRIAINKNYLLEYLTRNQGMITTGTESESSPVLFHYGTRPIVAIMPMKASWGDEQAEEAKVNAEPVSSEETTSETESETEGDEEESAAETDAGETDDSDDPTSVDYNPDNDMHLQPIEDGQDTRERPEYTGPPVATVERLDIGTPEPAAAAPETKKKGGRRLKKKTE